MFFIFSCAWQTKMPMSCPAYMHASIATPGFAANHHTGNGRGHLHIVERLDVDIIFPSWCSSLFTFTRNSICELQSGPGSYGNKRVLHIPQSSSITEASPSDCLVSYLGHSLGGGDVKAPFSIATTLSCMGGHKSIPWIASLYPWSLPYNANC